jgi:hypothetical protein
MDDANLRFAARERDIDALGFEALGQLGTLQLSLALCEKRRDFLLDAVGFPSGFRAFLRAQRAELTHQRGEPAFSAQDITYELS